MVEKLELVKKCMEEKKARDIVDIKISEKSSITDYFVICTGSSDRNIQAIADEISEKMKESQHTLLSVSGYKEANWILLDFGDVIVHIFDEATRDYYRIEEIWGGY